MAEDATQEIAAKERCMAYCQSRALETLRAVFNAVSPAVANVPEHDGVRSALKLIGSSLDVLGGDRHNGKALADLNRAFEAMNLWINYEAPDVRPLGEGEKFRNHANERNLVNSGIAAIKILEMR